MASTTELKLSLISNDADANGKRLGGERKIDRLAIYTQQHTQRSGHLLMKGQILLGMVFLMSGYTLMGRYTRSAMPPSQLYYSSTVVLLSECLKITLTLFFLFKESHFAVREFYATLKKEFFDKPLELLKMSLPSFAYALQNNLEFVALSNLEAHVYQVISQLKVVTTALFMMVFLGRTFSLRRWIAILLLFGGVALVQISQLDNDSPIASHSPNADNSSTIADSSSKNNALVGLAAILACCATAGFAGVYFEAMLKDGSSTPFWIRNLQMYLCGIIGSGVGCYMADYARIRENGFFHGYNQMVSSVVVLMGLNGLYVSLAAGQPLQVVRVTSNFIMVANLLFDRLGDWDRSFRSSVSIVLVTLISMAIFPGAHVSSLFFVGTVVVCFSITLYNSVNE